MKKVFLSLAVIAALTVVSCKQTESTDAPAADSTAVEAPADTTAAPAPADTTAVDTTKKAEEAPKAEAPKAEAPAKK